MKQLSRRNFLKFSSIASAATMLPHVGMPLFASEKTDTVRDRLWIWGHVEGVYDNAWGLPRNSRMTPLQAAGFLDTPNLIMVRYDGKPAPPFDEYAAQYNNLTKLMWSFVSAGGGTSAEEQEYVFDLARKMPNITGFFMDDFFHANAMPVLPTCCWLAENHVSFPVVLTLHCKNPVEADRLELQQTAWKTGDYRTSDVAVDLREEGNWKELGTLRLENSEGAKASLVLPGKGVKSLRLRFLGTHDTDGARSVGLGGLRLLKDGQSIDLSEAEIKASSSYSGHPPENLLRSSSPVVPEAPASITVAQLQKFKQKMEQFERKLDLGVTLYTHQLNPAIRRHLDLCDVVSFWSWTADELAQLPKNFAKYQELVPNKRTLLGIYMWDFGLSKPLPMDLMKMQCDMGLKWLKNGTIEGMIFLASNICDMNIEAVEWSKQWIAKHGKETL